MSKHRFSGWPGAWCLDCGQNDPCEECLADHHDQACFKHKEECNHHEYDEFRSCPEPNSNRHNPYVRTEEKKKDV